MLTHGHQQDRQEPRELSRRASGRRSMPGLLDDRLGGEYLNTLTSCCLTNKEDRLSQTRPQDRTEVSDAQQNPRETILLSLSPCSHGLDLRLAALKGGRGGRSWGGASAAGTGLGRGGRLCHPAPHPLQRGGATISLANVKTIIKPTQSLLLVIALLWQS